MYNGRVNVSLKNSSDNGRQDRTASLCRSKIVWFSVHSLAHIFLSFVFKMKKELNNHRPPSSINDFCVLPMPWPLRSLEFSLAPRRRFYLLSVKIDFHAMLKFRPILDSSWVDHEWIVSKCGWERMLHQHQLDHFEMSNKNFRNAVRVLCA